MYWLEKMKINKGKQMYRCPKCASSSEKEKIEVIDCDGIKQYPQTGDRICQNPDCAYIGDKQEFVTVKK